MIPTKNLSPFLFGYRACSRRPPQPEMTVIVRGKFTLAPDQPVVPFRADLRIPKVDEEDTDERSQAVVDEAEQMLGQGTLNADVFEDDDDTRAGEVLYPSDFALFKPKCDVMLKGTCYPPRATSECTAGFYVGDWGKRLRVVGPRVWTDTMMGGSASPPVAFTEQPLGYKFSFGGPDIAANPVGRGHGTKELPNVERLDQPLERSDQVVAPGGFGPINPAWPPRSGKLGESYGSDYEEKQAPWLASDTDWTYFNAAPEDQQLKKYLAGDETLRFENLHPEVKDWRAELPGVRARYFFMTKGGDKKEVALSIDTLWADLDEGALYLTWRGCGAIETDDLSDVAYGLVASEALAEPARPAAEYFYILEQYAADPVGFEDTKIPAMKKLQDDIESGQLERDIDALPNDDKVLSNILHRIVGPLLDDKQLGELKAQADASIEGLPPHDPTVPIRIKESVKEALQDSIDGSPTMSMNDKGEATSPAGPLLKAQFAELGKAQKTASKEGVDFDDVNEEIEDGLDAVEDEHIGASVKGLRIEALGNRQDVEPAPGADCAGMDLTGRDLAGRDLTGINLEGAILKRANLEGAILTDANLQAALLGRANLRKATAHRADFTGAMMGRIDLEGADLTGACLDRAALLRANVMRAKLHDVSAEALQGSRSALDGSQWHRANLFTATFDNCEGPGASFDGANLTRMMFRQCKLPHASFIEACVESAGFLESDLTGAVFQKAHGPRASWHRATLVGADFRQAKLPENMFMEANLKEARYQAAELVEARFYRAILRDAGFEGADLYSADLRKTSLTRCKFVGANLYLARFIEAFGTDADLREANTKMANFKRCKLVTK